MFGVGDPYGGAVFCPVYTVALPVGQPGALDDDDIHEFAAADLLADLQRRATRRGWSMRVEVEVEQTAADAAGCDLYAQGPEEATALQLLAQADTPGGGRRLTLGQVSLTRPRRWCGWPVATSCSTPPVRRPRSRRRRRVPSSSASPSTSSRPEAWRGDEEGRRAGSASCWCSRWCSRGRSRASPCDAGGGCPGRAPRRVSPRVGCGSPPGTCATS
ncbi:hypothetical protein [Nannocystis pusilla]|uniref:hypothetical protein n=1 Tax=Nannocystis pusilla TaxID=889268 RepID=UPI003B7E39F8